MKPKVTYIKDKKPSFEELKKMVGGYIEFAYDDGNTQIICNEEGKIFDLPFNLEATDKWGDLLGYEPKDFLVGDVVILEGNAKLE